MWNAVGQIQGPKGDKGETGDDGQDGAQGPKGDKGDPGDDGQDGAQGPKGDKGDPGERGEAGTGVTIVGSIDGEAELDQNYDGSIGDMFIDQNTGTGYVWDGNMWNAVGQIQGPKGDKGDPGDDGQDGAQGPKGDKGDPGDDGQDGAQGPKGDKGDPGNDGQDGAQGPKGDKGDTGNDGQDGAQGPKGDKGDPGINLNITNIKEGDILKYDAQTKSWTNAPAEVIIAGGNIGSESQGVNFAYNCTINRVSASQVTIAIPGRSLTISNTTCTLTQRGDADQRHYGCKFGGGIINIDSSSGEIGALNIMLIHKL